MRIACRQKISIIISCAVALVGLSSSVAFAQGSSLSPFEASIIQPASFDEAIQNSAAETSRVTVINPVNDITVTAQVRGIGNVTVVFNREWRVPDVSYADNGFATLPVIRDGVHLQGYAEYRGGNGSAERKKIRVPAAATVFRSDSTSPYIEVLFLGETKTGGGHYYELKGELRYRKASGALRVRRVSHYAYAPRTCGLNSTLQKLQVAGVKSSSLSTSSATTKSLLSFDIATEADFDWVARYGTSSNTKIQSILNKVQTIYENQLNLTFNLTKQVSIETPNLRYLSSNAKTLLDTFTSYSELHGQLGNADLYHLFTGKDTFFIDPDDVTQTPNSSIIGLAWLGVVCNAPAYSYGLTEDLDDALNHVTTAHEMGHNFGADHDSAGSIMGTVLNLSNPPTSFSTNSRNVIADHVADNPSCLVGGVPGGGGGSNNPGEGDTSHISLSVSLKSNGIFTLTTGFSEIESGCTAEVRAGSTAGRAYEGTLIATPSTDVASVTYTGKVPRNAFQYVARSTRIQKVYIGVTKTCPSGTYYSMTKSISPYKVKSTKARLKIGSWIKLFARQTLAATPG